MEINKNENRMKLNRKQKSVNNEKIAPHRGLNKLRNQYNLFQG